MIDAASTGRRRAVVEHGDARGARQRRRRRAPRAAAASVRAHWRVLEAASASRDGAARALRHRRWPATTPCVDELLAPHADRLRAAAAATRRQGAARPSRAPTTRRRSCAASWRARRRSRALREQRRSGCPRRPATTSASGSASWSRPRSSASASATPRSCSSGSSRSPSARVARRRRAADGAFNSAFLVERDQVDAVRRRRWRELAAASSATGSRLRYVGPLPPYSFADAEREEARRWA